MSENSRRQWPVVQVVSKYHRDITDKGGTTSKSSNTIRERQKTAMKRNFLLGPTKHPDSLFIYCTANLATYNILDIHELYTVTIYSVI